MVIPGNKELDLIPKVPRVEASSDEVAELTVDPRNSERVSRGEIWCLLIKRLQDVSIHSFYISTWLFCACGYNFCFHSTHAISLSKMTKKVIIEDKSDVMLQKCVTELEEVNMRLEASNVEMHLTVGRSSEVVTTLWQELDVN
jgi:hypothetical protein